MVTAMTSVFLNIPVRKDVVMTGEVTGKLGVLPIGGLKEKLLAALREEARVMIVPQKNHSDLAEILKENPEIQKSVETSGLEIVEVSTVDHIASEASHPRLLVA